MSWRVVKCVLAHHDQKVRGVDLLALIYLGNHASNEDGSGAWPSQLTLAAETGLHRATVQRVLDRLVKASALEVEQRPGRTHRFRVVLCAVCRPRPNASQSGIRTNQGAAESGTGCRTVRHDPLSIPPREPPTNAVSASPLDERPPPAPPAGPESQPLAQNRKAEFVQRRAEEIRREQGDRAADAYLRTVARNDVRDEARAQAERLSSGQTYAGYGGFVPPKLQAQWDAMHPDTSLGEETGP
jgi:hypothetical protein